MIRLFLITSAFFFFGATALDAQHTHNEGDARAEKYCSTNEALERLLDEHPEYDPLIEEAERELERFTEDFEPQEFERGGNYIIPVVFHVVHANGDENISDAQIHDAIDIMTEDFTLQNSDITAVISAFESIVANVGIEFRLAKLDPNGNCTNGIVRVYSQQTFNGGENLKNISPAWPRSDYMNIWVAADLSSGAAGYTYTPGSVSGIWGADADGIVIKHTYVGSIGTGSPTRSRALTHEVGHWINLRHPWGGTNDPGLSENCNSDDNVDDTPNTRGWTSCSLFGESCGSLDNVQNFMEYSYCSKMFTEGQKARMLAALNSSTASRNNLHSLSNLQSTGVLMEGELCNVEIIKNVDWVCAGDSVVYSDNSFHNVTTRNWTFEGGNPSTATGEQVVVYYDEPGTYDVLLEVSNGNESISETFPNTIKVWPVDGVPLDYSEDFENVTNFDEEWFVVDNGTNNNWELVNDIVGASGNSALSLDNRFLDDGDVSEIWSQPIDLSNTNTDVEVHFKYAYARRNDSNNEKLFFRVSYDCGQSWTLRGIWFNDFETVPFTNGDWEPTSTNDWVSVTVDNLTESALVSNFRFKFEFESDDGNNIYIDDINITGPVATGIEDIDISSNVSVFPNPATSELNVAVNGERPYQFDLQLVNTLGKVILSQGAMTFGGGQQQYSIDTQALSPGVYMLHMQTDAGKRAVKQVLIIR